MPMADVGLPPLSWTHVSNSMGIVAAQLPCVSVLSSSLGVGSSSSSSCYRRRKGLGQFHDCHVSGFCPCLEVLQPFSVVQTGCPQLTPHAMCSCAIWIGRALQGAGLGIR